MAISTRIEKARIRTARTEMNAARVAFLRDSLPLRTILQRHRTAFIVAGGFVSGFALSSFSPRLWSRVGAVVASGTALVARSIVTPMIAGAIMARQQTDGSGGHAQAPH